MQKFPVSWMTSRAQAHNRIRKCLIGLCGLLCAVLSQQTIAQLYQPDPRYSIAHSEGLCEAVFGLDVLQSALFDPRMTLIRRAEPHPVFRSEAEHSAYLAAQKADLPTAKDAIAKFATSFSDEASTKALYLSLMHRYVDESQMDDALRVAIQIVGMHGTSWDALATGALIYQSKFVAGPFFKEWDAAGDFGQQLLFAFNGQPASALSNVPRAIRSIGFEQSGIAGLSECASKAAENAFNLAKEFSPGELSASFYARLAWTNELNGEHDAATANLKKADGLMYADQRWEIEAYGQFDPSIASVVSFLHDKLRPAVHTEAAKDHAAATAAAGVTAPTQNVAKMTGAPKFTIIVIRDYKDATGIYGHINLGGSRIYTLERTDTILPAGTFKGDMRYWSPSGHVIDGDFLLELEVPGHPGVQVHIGNASFQSQGCILVGTGTGQVRVQRKDQPGYVDTKGVVNSRGALEKLRTAFYGTASPLSSPNVNIEVQVTRASDFTNYIQEPMLVQMTDNPPDVSENRSQVPQGPSQIGHAPVGAPAPSGAGAATHPVGQRGGPGILDAGGGGHPAAEHGPAAGAAVGGGARGGAAHGTVTVGQDRATVQIRDANTGAARSKEEDLGPAAKPNE